MEEAYYEAFNFPGDLKESLEGLFFNETDDSDEEECKSQKNFFNKIKYEKVRSRREDYNSVYGKEMNNGKSKILIELTLT